MNINSKKLTWILLYILVFALIAIGLPFVFDGVDSIIRLIF